MKRKQLYTLCESAIMIAMATVLSFIEIQLGASGGSINFAMLPLFIICYRNGALWGIGSGLIFGLIKCIIGSGISWGLPSILLDYVLAYGAVGIAGFFKGKSKYLEISALIGCTARYFIHFLSGILLWQIVEPTTVDAIGVTFINPYAYSAVYNIVYMLPSSVGVIILLSLLRKPLKKIDNKYN